MKKWFILRVFSGKEERIAQLLKERLRQEVNQETEIIIPTRKTTKFRKEGRVTVEEKVYPGYIMVGIEEPSEETFKAISRVSGILTFGKKGKISRPMDEEEVRRMLGYAKIEPTKMTQIPYMKGDTLKIVDGPLAGFIGKVEEVFPDRQRIKLMVTIFGRQTPVDVSFSEVEPL